MTELARFPEFSAYFSSVLMIGYFCHFFRSRRKIVHMPDTEARVYCVITGLGMLACVWVWVAAANRDIIEFNTAQTAFISCVFLREMFVYLIGGSVTRFIKTYLARKRGIDLRQRATD